jgi:histone H3/H4
MSAMSAQGAASVSTQANITPTASALAQALDDANNRIEEELKRRKKEPPMVMSDEAKDKLATIQTEMIADVGIDAVRIARRKGLKTVDQQHVNEAASNFGLGNGGSFLGAIVNNIGGILTGAGIASIYAIIFTPGPHGSAEVLVGYGLSVIGSICMAVSITLSVMKK